MSLVRKILIPALAAIALTATVSIAGAATASASIEGTGYGTGSTSTMAETAAKRDLVGNYHGCAQPVQLVYDTKGSNGVWSAEVDSTCEWAN